MTIRKGEPWGAELVLVGDEPEARTDAEAAALLVAGGPDAVVVLRGGDLHHSLGGRPDLPAVLGAGSTVLALPVDLIEVRVGAHDEPWLAVAHVVARRRGWAGEFAVAMGGTHLGDWNLGPKAHPNDGLVDVTRGSLELRDRLAARRRAVTGTHVPHPRLRTERVRETVWELERPTPLLVDGVRAATATEVSLRVLPDRGNVVVG